MTNNRRQNMSGLRRQVFEFGRQNESIINNHLRRNVFFGYTDESAGPYAAMLYADRLAVSNGDIARVRLNGHGLELSDYLSGIGLRNTDVVIVSPTYSDVELNSLRAQAPALHNLGVEKVLYFDVIGHGMIEVSISDSGGSQK